MGIPWTLVWQGVGIIGAGIWDYLLLIAQAERATAAWTKGARRGEGRRALARQPPHARHGASRIGCGRRSDHEHRRARVARHAFPVLTCADGSEAEGAARDRGTANRGRRQAPQRRAATAGCDRLSCRAGSVSRTRTL